MAYETLKGKTPYLSTLTLRTEAVDGGTIPDDEVQADFCISNNEIDGHHSVMTEKSLRNYVEDASNHGTPFMLNHSSDQQMQIGQIISARYDEAGKQAIATIRMLRDTDDTPQHLRVNEYIRRMERNMYNSCSIAYSGGVETCRLDGKPIFDWTIDDPCPHIPGRVYDGERCVYDIDDAHLREVSLVPTPSNKGAKLLDTREWPKDLLEIKQEGEPKADATDAKSLLERDGLKWRKELIDKALAEGNRAEDNFDEDTWKKRLEANDSAYILAQTDMWTKLGDARWGEGGRKTETVGGSNVDTGESNLILPAWLFS